MNQLSLNLRRRDTALAAVSAGAERAVPGWNERAHWYLLRWLNGRREPFIAEEFVTFAEAAGLPEPVESRAYGPVLRNAAKAGLIVKAGYATDKFCSPKTLWEAA